MNILYWHRHLLSFVQSFPEAWFGIAGVTCMCAFFNTGTLHEVALWKDWPKFTPTQQRVSAGSAHPDNTWYCQSLSVCQPEKRRQLLKSVPFCLFLGHACACSPLKLPTPNLASKLLVCPLSNFISLFCSGLTVLDWNTSLSLFSLLSLPVPRSELSNMPACMHAC